MVVPLVLWLLAGVVQAQQTSLSGGKRGAQITFLPPPLERASFSLGIYEAKSGRLIRRLHEAAPESAFTAGLNGLITRWDGKDDVGKPMPTGPYAARGYAVGPLKVEGVEFLGNDWMDEDESLRIKRVETIILVPEDDGLGVVATMADGSAMLLRFSGKDGALLWKRKLPSPPAATPDRLELWVDARNITVSDPRGMEIYQLADGSPSTETPSLSARNLNGSTRGKDDTIWLVAGGALYQLPPGANLAPETVANPEKLASLALRVLAPKDGEPAFKSVAASVSRDRLYLLEELPGWQRVRGLSCVEVKQEDGKQVSNWETFFERSIRPSDPARGLVDPAMSKAPLVSAAPPVKLDLVENPLVPGKAGAVELTACIDEKGSYLGDRRWTAPPQDQPTNRLAGGEVGERRRGGRADVVPVRRRGVGGVFHRWRPGNDELRRGRV